VKAHIIQRDHCGTNVQCIKSVLNDEAGTIVNYGNNAAVLPSSLIHLSCSGTVEVGSLQLGVPPSTSSEGFQKDIELGSDGWKLIKDSAFRLKFGQDGPYRTSTEEDYDLITGGYSGHYSAREGRHVIELNFSSGTCVVTRQ
jgi:hypothetical protein